MKYFILTIPAFLLSLLSCSPKDFMAPEDPDIPITILVENSEFFPETGDTGEFVFYTNDSRYIKTYGMTFWAIKLPEQIVFDQVDISLSRISGDQYAGFGFVFCHGLRGDPAVKTMLVFMINLNQEYIIGEVFNDRFTVLVPWTSYLGLYPGYNQENRIKISFDPINEEFQLFINNHVDVLTTFKDDNSPVHRSGSSGFLTVISPLDKFPEIPVHIIFKNNTED
ncbi:MAG: hypothetical protein PF518_18320 [Spirochaetaceae bacterium]|jgi:hypothetical protein|nr:hypothetical protein [Spirochaetaceae bacterium]